MWNFWSAHTGVGGGGGGGGGVTAGPRELSVSCELPISFVKRKYPVAYEFKPIPFELKGTKTVRP